MNILDNVNQVGTNLQDFQKGTESESLAVRNELVEITGKLAEIVKAYCVINRKLDTVTEELSMIKAMMGNTRKLDTVAEQSKVTNDGFSR